LGSLNPPPQLLEFKHSNGKDGPDLEDRRKARIEQIHLSNSAQTEKTAKIRMHNTSDPRLSVMAP
jgi:hypothetical protein